MLIKLDKDTFDKCDMDKQLQAIKAELLIYKVNRYVEYIPSASILTCIYKVKVMPIDDYRLGVKWLKV